MSYLRAIVMMEEGFGPPPVVHDTAILDHQPVHSPALARTPNAPRCPVMLGTGTVISPYVVIYGGVRIGRDCLVGDHVSIRENVTIGNRCIVGRNVSIDCDCEIGDDVKFLDKTHITGGMKIGKGTFFGVGVVTSNDRRLDPSDYRFHKMQGPQIGDYCLIGTGANILAGVTIGDRAVIGAGALVVKDVPPGATVLGPIARVQ